MLPHLADVSVRSLLLALLAAAFLQMLGSRRTAALQHAIWAAVMCGMLTLFAFGHALPRLPLHILNRATPAEVSSAAVLTEPLIPDKSLAGASMRTAGNQPLKARPMPWQDLVSYAYFAIVFAFLAHLVTGIFLVRKLLATALPIQGFDENRVWECGAITVPVSVGWVRSRILLPLEWREWNRKKLDAVLAHEGGHVRRRDGLVAALAGLNRCLFWFHPLAWMLERKLALLAEQGCDDACVAALGDRESYARLLLEMAHAVNGARGRLGRHALTMAAASHMRQRIDALLREKRTFSRGLSGTAWASLLLCGVPVILCAGIVQLEHQPPVQIAQLQTPPVQPAFPAVTPKFDSASIKPCAPGDGAGRAGRGGGTGRGIPISPPGEQFMNCMSVFELINQYVTHDRNPLLNDSGGPVEPQRVRGGPPWIYTDLYTIDAVTTDPLAMRTDDNNTQSVAFRLLNGTMLQALLQDRFQLKTHRVLEEIPMYALRVAGGFKLQPMEAGGCIPLDPEAPFEASDMFPSGSKPLCISHGGWEGPNWTYDAAGQSPAKLAELLSAVILDRPVLDQTGITGLFAFHLKFAHDRNAPGRFPPGMNPFPTGPSDVSVAPSITTVLEQQLGLTLAPVTGPREFIFVDSAERPAAN